MVTEQTIGQATPGAAWTLITFIDGSSLRVHWDEGHEVAGLHRLEVVTIYQPDGRRTHIPGHRISRIDHQEAAGKEE